MLRGAGVRFCPVRCASLAVISGIHRRVPGRALRSPQRDLKWEPCHKQQLRDIECANRLPTCPEDRGGVCETQVDEEPTKPDSPTMEKAGY